MMETDKALLIDKHNLKPLSDQAYVLLKRKIMSEGSGAYISARQFATEVGISYTPVREAFLRLQKEGALKLVPNVGFFVQSLDLPDLLQILEVREAIETFVWDKVFDHLGLDSLIQMKNLVKQQREAVISGDAFMYHQVDKSMHEIPFRIYAVTPFLSKHPGTIHDLFETSRHSPWRRIDRRARGHHPKFGIQRQRRSDQWHQETYFRNKKTYGRRLY
jgi:DNA-binding GntR family transcriptional regulator